MDKRSISETIIALEKEAMQAWIKGDPTPFLELYSKDFSYFDPDQQLRLDGFDKIKELYESMRGTVLMDNFEMINPLVQLSDSMVVLSYNLNIYLGKALGRKLYIRLSFGRRSMESYPLSCFAD